MTEQEKVDAVVEHLETGHLQAFGGYPAPTHWVGDTLIYTCGMDDEPWLEEISRADIITWADRAIAEFEEHGPESPSDTWVAYLNEVDAPVK